MFKRLIKNAKIVDMQTSKVFIPMEKLLPLLYPKGNFIVEEEFKKLGIPPTIGAILRTVITKKGELAYTQRHFYENRKPKGIEIEENRLKVILEGGISEVKIDIEDLLYPIAVEVLEKVITGSKEQYIAVFYPYSEVDDYRENKLRNLLSQANIEVDVEKFLTSFKGVIKLHKEDVSSFFEEYIPIREGDLDGISLIVVKDALLWKRIENGEFSGSYLVRFYQNFKLKRDWVFRKLKELGFDNTDLEILQMEITKAVDYSPLFGKLLNELRILEITTTFPLSLFRRKKVEEFRKAIREMEIYLFGDEFLAV